MDRDIYRPDGSADMRGAINNFSPDKTAIRKNSTEGMSRDEMSRRDFGLGVIAMFAGALIGNESGNLVRDAMESNAVQRAEKRLPKNELQSAEAVAEQLAQAVETYRSSLEEQHLGNIEEEERVRSYVLMIINSFNEKEIVPNFVPASSSSVVSPESQE
ncbi:MAG: hypothetical protein PHW75_00785 [Patescibacteria group bacterium]|nr:hypothetical protein [Patescibacteria group bacterium]